ncbi:MAG: hypothetical protein QOE08_927 [Thermoleophilaceae bacterium]|jgi:hypothetical protein|nr:hypothetical protein [Thermoleophilaceae bacterium]
MRALRRTLNGLAASVAALALLGTGSAFASSVSLSSGVLSYTGAPAEANHVTFTFDLFHGYAIQDTGVAAITVPTSLKTCHAASPQTVYCNWGSFASIAAHLGNGGSFAQSKLALTAVAIYAGSGDDTLIGGGGADTLTAGAGSDTLTAGSGNTRLVGGSGVTTMTGGAGHNTYQGGTGADTINARNGIAEAVTCADGSDTVAADTDDTTAADCETVDRGAGATAPIPGTPGTPAAAPAPFVVPVPAISTAPVALTPANTVPVAVGCPATATSGCVGTITLALADGKGSVSAARRAKRRLVSKAKRFRIKAGRKVVVPVTLSRRGGRAVRRTLRSHKWLKLAVTVSLRSEAGSHTTTRKILVHSARRSVRKPKPSGARRR